MQYNPGILKDIEVIGNIPIVPTLLEVICRTTGMGFAAIARVTETNWVACAVRDEIAFGLQAGGELELETTICHEIRTHQQPVVIDHVEKDPRYAHHHTPALYGFQSYISLPVHRRDGSLFGTLCAIDPRPARLNNPETIGMFKLYAELISFHLEAQEQLVLKEEKLAQEHQEAEQRERFVAILGHDLRNPVAAMSTSAKFLQKMSLDPLAMNFVDIIRNSSLRATGLINRILDFANGRFSGGVPLTRQVNLQLEESLKDVITELQIVSPNRVIRTEFNLGVPVNCDNSRVAQMFSNLLGNAITHSDPREEIVVKAYADAQQFKLVVSNKGKPIPKDLVEHLFEPFSKGEEKPGKHGLGLGLYISAEIARAHGGSLEVVSNENETSFIFEMPNS